jgi:hypothetical protein
MLSLLVRKVFELSANSLLVWVFFNHPDQLEVKSSRHRSIVYACAVFFAVSILVQSLMLRQYQYPNQDEYFPFTRWAMFAGDASTSTSVADYAWQGICVSGRCVLVNPAILIPTVNAVAHFTKTTKIAEHLRASSPDRVQMGRNAVVPYATGLLRRYNMLHPADPLVGLVLWYRPIPINPGTVVPEYFDEATGERVWDSRDSPP